MKRKESLKFRKLKKNAIFLFVILFFFNSYVVFLWQLPHPCLIKTKQIFNIQGNKFKNIRL